MFSFVLGRLAVEVLGESLQLLRLKSSQQQEMLEPLSDPVIVLVALVPGLGRFALGSNLRSDLALIPSA